MISEFTAQMINVINALIIVLSGLWLRKFRVSSTHATILSTLATSTLLGIVLFDYFVNTHVFYLVYVILDAVCIAIINRAYVHNIDVFANIINVCLIAKVVCNAGMYVTISRLSLTNLNFDVYSVFIIAVDIVLSLSVVVLCYKSRLS